MSSVGESGGAELSTSRINRLLRPLRSRCSSLASFAKSRTRQPSKLTTYGSRGGASPDEKFEAPPLLILLPPGSMGLHKLKDIDNAQVEMARRVYAVRDCFRDIVVNTGRRTSDTAEHSECLSRVMSLATMCSIVVGNNIECHAERDDGDDEEEDVEDEDDANLVDELYESIPQEHRRWAVLSHALSLVLNSTVHHPTLLIILLDLALDHKLQHESHTLLRAALSLALGVTASHVPPICHPAHSNFILDLCRRWTTGGLSESVFFQTCLKVLERVERHDAWTCKAVHNLAQAMYGRDFASFLWLIKAFAAFAASAADEATHRNAIESRMSVWLTMTFERRPTNPPVVSGETESGDFSDAVGEMLLVVFATQDCDRTPRAISGNSNIEVRGLLLCLATSWLASQTHTSTKACLVDHLREALPQSSTFTPLVMDIFLRSDGSLDALRRMIGEITSALKFCGLFQLEASLWACALRHVELPASERQLANRHSITQVQSYRRELIGLVDDSEQRCRGHQVLDSPNATSPLKAKRFPPVPRFRNEHLDGVWEREASAACWIRRKEDPQSSSRKRRKLGHPQRHSPSRPFPQSPLCMRPRVSRSSVPVASPLGPNRAGTRRGPFHSNGATKFDDVGVDSPLRLHSKSRNFSSLLSDALSNRAALHPTHRKHVRLESETIGRYPEADCQHAVPCSDDSLDLFAWTSSSPIQP